MNPLTTYSALPFSPLCRLPGVIYASCSVIYEFYTLSHTEILHVEKKV